MPVSSTLKTPNPENTTWNARATVTLLKREKDPSYHAEQAAWKKVSQDPPYLFVQNAFPCEDCHAFLTKKSNTYVIIVRITENQGAYSFDHGLGANPNLPMTIYYRNGVVTYVAAGGAAPNGFPAHPPIV